MRFRLQSLLLLLTAVAFLLAAYMPLARAAQDDLFEIAIAFAGSIVAAVLLVATIVAEERPAARPSNSRQNES
jgi:hypothetical protein